MTPPIKTARWPVAILGALAISACNTSTSGGLISSLPVEIGGVARDAPRDSPLTFTTLAGGAGWTVELDQALVAVGPFYFNVDPPETQTLESGVVIVQLTKQVIVDPLDPMLYDGGTADGESGHAVSAEIDLVPPDFTQTGIDFAAYESGACEGAACTYQDFLGSASAFIQGSASRELEDGGTQTLPFKGFVTIDQSLVPPNDPAAFPLVAWQRVSSGCDLQFTTQPEVLQARIDPSGWFDGVDFSTLLPPAPPTDGGILSCPATANFGWTPDSGAPLGWCTDSSFNQELVNGLRAQTGGYEFSLAPEGGGS